MGKNYTAESPARVAQLKEQEAARKRLDPGYLTAEEAAAIPQNMRHDPAIVARVRASEPYWPERVAAASQVFKTENLQGGQGEVTDHRRVDAASLFEGPHGTTRDEG